MKTILFDLDGTLLPMDQEKFVEAYFGLLAKKLAPHGYEPKPLVDAIWKGTAAMVKNDGSCTNEQAFWRQFVNIFGERVRRDEPLFEEYYHQEFERVRQVCGFAPKAAETVKALKAAGCRVALATNPIFPAVATQARIRWAGLDARDFELVTTYENSRFCKPNPAYYQEILRTLDAAPEDCCMVGNDVKEDMAAARLGMQVFLLTDCLINPEGEDIHAYPHGSFEELMAFLERMGFYENCTGCGKAEKPGYSL